MEEYRSNSVSFVEFLDFKLNKQKGTSANLIRFIKDRPGHDRRYAIDSSKIQKELKLEAKIRF